MKSLAIKVDIDTLRGYREGVPRLLDLLARLNIRATFFFSFGPDNSGKAIRRIFRKGFLQKMLRTKAPSTYGLRTLLYGTLLPAPMIVASAPEVFVRTVAEGHECGIHAWDHVLVQDRLAGMSEHEFTSLYERAEKQFTGLSGCRPDCYAAPGWQISSASLAAEERLGLRYASDTRGESPFIPALDGRRYSVLQIPTTLPTMDEILWVDGVTDETLPGLWADMSRREWNVLTIHAEMEGISKLHVFDRFLKIAMDRGLHFAVLGDIARQLDLGGVPCHEIRIGTLPGRAGSLAVQGERFAL